MHTLAAKMKAFNFPLIIYLLKLLNKFSEQFVSIKELCCCDDTLVKKSNAGNKFAIVCPINVRKDIKKNAWSKGKPVRKKFPCLISTGNFLGRVTRWVIEGIQEVWFSISDSFSVILPSFAFEYSPIPCITIVTLIAIEVSTPKVNEKICEIE